MRSITIVLAATLALTAAATAPAAHADALVRFESLTEANLPACPHTSTKPDSKTATMSFTQTSWRYA